MVQILPDRRVSKTYVEPLRLKIDPTIPPSSSVHKYNCAIIRIFGNNLYPLQQVDQGSVNLRHIVQEELRYDNCPNIWIINRVINDTEKTQLLNLLREEQHLIQIDLDMERVKNHKFRPRDALHYLTDVNNARNLALNYAKQLGAEWIILLDGNSFLTTEGFSKLTSFLRQQRTMGKLATFIPMTRVLPHWDTKTLKADSELVDLLGAVSNIQEPYMAFHNQLVSNAQHQNVTIFDTNNRYGKQSKLYLLRQLHQDFSSITACLDAFGKCALMKKDSSVDDFAEVAMLCGYAIRMLYWPNGQAQQQDTRIEDNSSRSSRRNLSFSFLRKYLEMYVQDT